MGIWQMQHQWFFGGLLTFSWVTTGLGVLE